MDCLWKKESSKSDSLYVDYSVAIDEEFKYLVQIRLDSARKQHLQKCDADSLFYLELGNEKALKTEWDDATELFNCCLCMAENGSPIIQTAYGRRAECFFNRGLFKNVATDIDLILNRGQPSKMRSECTSFVPSLSFSAHKQFPCLANVLEVAENDKFGRHILAKCDIDVGQTIVMAKHFATVACSHGSEQAYCFTCFKTDANFIPCDQCTNVMFCSKECRDRNKVHRLECNSIYHQLKKYKIKLAIQMFLNAVQHFPNAEEFIEFVEGVLCNLSPVIKKMAKKPIQQYELLLRLKRSSNEKDLTKAFTAFETIMTFPVINSQFDTTYKQRFLMHLLLHHLGIVQTNSFRHVFGREGNLEIGYIYDVLSLFNHSCAPNTHYHVINNVGYMITIRPIIKGDQIFINYLGDRSDQSKSKRQKYLQAGWEFNCECDACEPLASHSKIKSNEMAMKKDEAFRYIMANYNDYKLPYDSAKRTRLRNECLTFLAKYGNCWSKSLSLVTDLLWTAMDPN